MNFERGLPIPRHGNGDSWSSTTPQMPIPHVSGIGHGQGSWTTTMLEENGIAGGVDSTITPRRLIPAVNGTVSGPASWSTVNPEQPTPMGNGIVDNRDSWSTTMETTILKRNGNGIVHNNDDWKSATSRNPFTHRNGIGQRTPWTPGTPEKHIYERSNAIPVDMQEKQPGNENWQDLIGMYTDLLQEETLHLDGIADTRNQNRLANATKTNLNPRSIPSSYPNHSQAATSFVQPNGPANWNGNLLATIVGSEKSPTRMSASANGAGNDSFHDSNRLFSSNPPAQIGSNHMRSTAAGSMLGSRQTQTFISNKLIGKAHNMKDGFPVPYRPRYNLSSPPRSKPDAATSSITGSFKFAPVTPNNRGKHMERQWVPEYVKFPVEETSTPAKDWHENQKVSIEDAANLYNELLQTVGNSPSSAISTTQKEHTLSEERDELGNELNKTPQQKMQARRKKHRPKVIREGKSKRTPKPKDPKNGTSDGTPVKRKYVKKKDVNISEMQHGDDEKIPVVIVRKRKYVRKKGIDNFESLQKSREDDVTASVVETPATKSCKKQLNFNLECVAQDEINDRGSQQGICFNVNPRDVEQERRINGIFETSAMKIGQQNKYIGGTMQAGNQSLPDLNVPTTPVAKARGHALNVLARNLTIRNSILRQDRWENVYNQVNHHVHGEGIRNIIFQAGMASPNLERVQRPDSQSTPQSFTGGGVLGLDERRGIKRQSSEQMHRRNINGMDSLLLYKKLLLGVDRHTDDTSLSSSFLENHKKTKLQGEFRALVSSEPSYVAPLEDDSRRKASPMNAICRNGAAMQFLNSCTKRVDHFCRVMRSDGNVDNRHLRLPMDTTHNLQKHQVSYRMQPHTIRSVAERSGKYTQGHEISSVTAMISWNLPPTPPKEGSRSAVTTYPASLLGTKQSAERNPYNQRLNGLDKMLHHHLHNALEGYQQSSTIAKGQARRQKDLVSADDIAYKLEGLHIHDGNKKEQNTLVPYRGSKDIIPFEPIQKRNTRPKVDLDPETDRLWKLLMCKEGSEGTETLDKDKEKWWEDERRVFRGRADSFIARMHLVQGDRRFSRWKGSVVDSVIGVFLTQNVSDHLSSSAFMSLAAKFPIKSTATHDTCSQDGACEEPIEMVEPNDTMTCHEKIRRQPVSDQSFCVSCESSENITHHISATRGTANKHNRISEEQIILSHDSCNSSTIQTVDEIRSSTGSNSEPDQTTGFGTTKPPGPPVNLIQAEKPSTFKELQSHENRSTLLDEHTTTMHHLLKDHNCNVQIPRKNLNCSSGFTPSNSTVHLPQESLASSNDFQMNVTPGLQVEGSLLFEMLGGESISSFPSSNSGMTIANHSRNATYQQNEVSTFQAPSQGQYNYPSNHPTHRKNLQTRLHVAPSQHSQTNTQQAREFFTEMTGHAETLAKGRTGAQKQDSAMFGGIAINVEDRTSAVDKQNHLENIVLETNSKKKNYTSHEPPSGTGTNMSKARKGTTQDEKSRETNWDSLRKKVLSNVKSRERSKDATDSLDYEALRRAPVNEISDIIKERGMNNLLADRIKDFLNRLVRDHGSIDLEWLRDAPPDKAKDYLLSFRGLGLKSVECVRLLTLHHLAFPVDTNVGRIAVRLGWVPLQPLPESLQLHLLEMYPVLESIQKYLWPRLCKLDQLTLYELHYQMITFGKVFCTKSKPNCNACPMKAECRHFASAFASVRLALPGPEEKRIVTSDAPVATDPTPPVVISPMPLPPAENNCNEYAGTLGRTCEPIIEEPTTPEPETAEVSISDIEDQYYEDSDEIPSIKLNMQEFTTNLQNIMQDNTELQDDMSKALVALNPTAAYIPTPQLKNVSRLRTEHQVYELPDSHQLLEGLDKREPDDPSPYLLAIWTPGETANSVQPPERGCSGHESSKLCEQLTCFSCNSIKEANSQVVRGTILIPCRTAMRGSFPLNGTYFQVNEMFADHASSLNPIDVPRALIWNLPRRSVYFGTSVSTIFKGLTTEGIQHCFWRGFVCVRGFDQKTRAPKPLMARLHFPASKLVKTRMKANNQL